MEGWLIVILIILGVSFISWALNNYNKAKKYEELKPRLHNLEAKETDLKNKEIWWEKRVQSDIAAINALAKEKSLGFPWLAEAYSDYFYLQDLKKDYSENPHLDDLVDCVIHSLKDYKNIEQRKNYTPKHLLTLYDEEVE